MFRVKTIIFTILIISIISFLVAYRLFFLNSPQPKVIINSQTIFVEIAKTPQEKEKGLSGRNSLNQDSGMLFIFDKPGKYPFWMKDMEFDLDFVFIRGDTVVELVENVPFPKQGEQPRVIQIKEPFNKVLEVNQGIIKKLGVKTGDKIEFLN